MESRSYLRGDIYYANLSPYIGSEQGGYRPVVIIQNDVGNKHSPTVIVAAVTSKVATKAKLPVHVPLTKKLGLEDNSIALLEQIRTLDKKRLEDYIGRIDDATMVKIDEALAVSVNLQHTNFDTGTVMCLCGNCANIFYDSDEHRIRRVDLGQTVKVELSITVQSRSERKKV